MTGRTAVLIHDNISHPCSVIAVPGPRVVPDDLTFDDIAIGGNGQGAMGSWATTWCVADWVRPVTMGSTGAVTAYPVGRIWLVAATPTILGFDIGEVVQAVEVVLADDPEAVVITFYGDVDAVTVGASWVHAQRGSGRCPLRDGVSSATWFPPCRDERLDAYRAVVIMNAEGSQAVAGGPSGWVHWNASGQARPGPRRHRGS